MTLTTVILFKTFNVLGLLADKAGEKKIKVTVQGIYPSTKSLVSNLLAKTEKP